MGRRYGFQTRFFQMALIGGLCDVDPDFEFFARRYAARRLVRRTSAEGTTAFNTVGSRGEGDKVQAEQFLERGLNLVGLGVEFKEQPGFRIRVKITGGDQRANSGDSAVAFGQQMRGLDPSLSPAFGFNFPEACVGPLQPLDDPVGLGPSNLSGQPGNAGVDIYLAVTEEIVVR